MKNLLYMRVHSGHFFHLTSIILIALWFFFFHSHESADNWAWNRTLEISEKWGPVQGGITCGAIDEPRKSLKSYRWARNHKFSRQKCRNCAFLRQKCRNCAFSRQKCRNCTFLRQKCRNCAFFRQKCINMANIFESLSKDGNITPGKARKSRQMQFHDKTVYVWMGILPLKKRHPGESDNL